MKTKHFILIGLFVILVAFINYRYSVIPRLLFNANKGPYVFTLDVKGLSKWDEIPDITYKVFKHNSEELIDLFLNFSANMPLSNPVSRERFSEVGLIHFVCFDKIVDILVCEYSNGNCVFAQGVTPQKIVLQVPYSIHHPPN